MIKPSSNLKPAIRRLVEASFRNAVDGISTKEFEYVEKNIKSKLRGLERARTRWVRDLAAANKALWGVYCAHRRGTIRLPRRSLQVVGAALFYLVDPFDIIPDHIPGDGYLDDAHVTNLCLKHLEKKHPEVFEDYFSEMK